MCRVLEGWYTAFVRALAGITSMERVYKGGVRSSARSRPYLGVPMLRTSKI